jgi:hypothetical protein
MIIYTEIGGVIFPVFLNNCLQEDLLLDLVMMEIISFCILNILIAWEEFPQNIIP